MKINFEHSGIEMEITYDENGYLDTVRNINTDTYMLLEIKTHGIEYDIKKEKFMIGGESNVCDARYIRIMDIDVFIPKFIFIQNTK